MNQETYSIMKQFETFSNTCKNSYEIHLFRVAGGLYQQYVNLYKILKNYLDEKELKFVPFVEERYIGSEGADACLIMEMYSSSNLVISYLRSKETSLDIELKIKEQELDQREKELEKYKKLLDKSIDAVTQLPEVFRSLGVAEWKKHHREIEENTKK